MSRTRLSNLLVLLILFVLPFQTRWIFNDLTIAGQPWEYGRLSLYATEALIVFASLLRGVVRVDARHEPLLKAAIFFLGALFLGASFSRNITLAFSAILHVSAAAALFALVLDERTDATKAASAFVLGLLVPSALAWTQVLTGLSPASTVLGLASHDAATLGSSVVETVSTRVLRGYGTLPHPNIFGGYLALGTVLAAWLASKGRRVGSVLPILAATLVVTFSRGAWIAAAVGLAVAFFLSVRPPTRVIFATVWTIILTVAIFHAPIFTRFDASARLEAKSVSERVSEFSLWPDVVRQNVFTGVGAGNYAFALAGLYPGKDVWSYQPIHDSLLLFIAETGLLGLLAAGRFFWVAVTSICACRTARGRACAVSVIFALVSVAAFDHYLWSLWPGMCLAALALAVALKSTVDSPSSGR